MKTMKIYISGKISGLPISEVVTKFREAERKIRKFGQTPINPLNNGLPIETEWADQMGKDIALLLRADAIYMLPDWQQRWSNHRVSDRPTEANASFSGRNLRRACCARDEQDSDP